MLMVYMLYAVMECLLCYTEYTVHYFSVTCIAEIKMNPLLHNIWNNGPQLSYPGTSNGYSYLGSLSHIQNLIWINLMKKNNFADGRAPCF